MATTSKIGIRSASVYDLFALEFLQAKGIEESNGLLPDYDQLHFFHSGLNMIAAGLVFVACDIDEAAKKERIVGCLALDGKKWAWNPGATVLQSVHFYVLPDARGLTLPDGKTMVFEGLLAAGQELADMAGIPLIVEQLHQVGPDNRAAAKDELFKRAGLSYVGGNHIYLPKPQPTADSKAA